MTKDEALKALIHEMEYVLSCINERKIPFDGDDFHEALRLGKKALAQPEQTNIKRHEANVQKFLGAPQPEQEPVAWMYVNTDGECEQIEYGEPFDDPSTTPLYTTPPQRTWVGLTDEEFNELDKEDLSLRQFVQAIDDRLKEKNT